MSNLQTATLAVEAEIVHAKNGLAYYAARVTALEQALAELKNVKESSDVSSPRAKPPKTPGTATIAAGAKQRKKTAKKSMRAEKESGELPSTGGDYWPNLLTEQGKHSSEVLKSAVEQLGFTPTRTQIKKLTQRMTFALNALVKAKKIQDSGSGRERLFFKK
jgi:hypothetical protein